MPKAYTHTLDIPVIINLAYPLGNMFEFGAGLGPQLSIPLKTDAEEVAIINGKSESQKLGDSAGKVKSNVNFGMVFDVTGKILFGSKKNIGVVIDVRYILDFTKTKITVTYNNVSTTSEMYTRRGLSLGLGLEYRL